MFDAFIVDFLLTTPNHLVAFPASFLLSCSDLVAKTPKTPGVRAYYETLQRVFALESSLLTGVLPHYGERRANDELRVREFLRRVLPRRFSIGTGFIVCSKEGVPPSPQTDIVIYDEFHNSPLHRELAADVFPVEMVYATVEVKAALRRQDLKSISRANASIREIARHGWYAHHVSMPKNIPGEPVRHIAVTAASPTTQPAPRGFVFAFAQRVWKRPESLQRALESSVASSHLHGLLVLDKNWFFAQEAYARPKPKFYFTTDDALMHFVTRMINSMSSMTIAQMSYGHYYHSFSPKPATD